MFEIAPPNGRMSNNPNESDSEDRSGVETKAPGCNDPARRGAQRKVRNDARNATTARQ